MGIHLRLAVTVATFGMAAAALVGAPAAVASCNDSSGTVVCAQGDIRGTDAPPPVQPGLGSYGTWCNGVICFPGGLFGVVTQP